MLDELRILLSCSMWKKQTECWSKGLVQSFALLVVDHKGEVGGEKGLPIIVLSYSIFRSSLLQSLQDVRLPLGLPHTTRSVEERSTFKFGASLRAWSGTSHLSRLQFSKALIFSLAPTATCSYRPNLAGHSEAQLRFNSI